MDTIAEMVDRLCMGDTTPESCQIYLDAPADANAEEMLPLMDATCIAELLSCVTRLSNSSLRGDKVDPAISIQIKKLGASALYTVNNSADANVVSAASRLLLRLCALPGATAYGVRNTNLLSTIANSLGKICGDEIKLPKPKGAFVAEKKKKGKGSKARAVKGGGDAPVVVGERQSRRIKDSNDKANENAKNSDSSNGNDAAEEEDDDDDDDEDEEEEEEDEGVDDDVDEEGDKCKDEDDAMFGRRRTSQRQQSAGKVRITSSSLHNLVKEFRSNIGLFWQRSEDHPLECCTDALSAVAFLSSFRADLSICNDESLAALVELGLASERSAVIVYRALMPALTMAPRDSRIPDNGKCRTAAHKVAVAVLLQLASRADEINNLWNKGSVNGDSDDTINNSLKDVRRFSGVGEIQDTESFRQEQANKQQTQSLPLSFACIVGAIQRMTVAVPDRAPVRATVLSSIVDVLTTLQESNTDSDSASDSGTDSDNSVINSNGAKAVNHYLLFLAKLSRCNKVGHRAYCLEIATAVLARDWVWSLASTASTLASAVTSMDVAATSASPCTPMPTPQKAKTPGTKAGADNDADSNSDEMVMSPHVPATPSTPAQKQNAPTSNSLMGPKALLELLVSRCDDTAPSVRVRAIAAVGDLLERLEEDSPVAMADYLLQLALGVEIVTPNGNGNGNDGVSKQTVNLLEILRARTLDDKPLVRAKAVQGYGIALCKKWPKHSITLDGPSVELVTMHMSEEDVSVFVDGCKDVSVAVRKQSVASLTLLVMMYPSNALLKEGWVMGALPLASDSESSVQAKVAQCAFDLLIEGAIKWDKAATKGDTCYNPNHFPLWSLCVNILSCGTVKLLRVAIGAMIAQNLITSSSTGGGCSIKALMKAVKTACCISTNSMSHASREVTTPQDADMISRGAWVLLEAILEQHSHTQSQTPSNLSPTLALQEGDFVVQCFREKRARKSAVMGASNASNIDEEGVRMLRVCEKVCRSVSVESQDYMINELQTLLSAMQCDAAATAAAVTCLFSLLKTKHADPTPFENHAKGYAAVQQWAGKFLTLAYYMTHSFVWGKAPENGLFGESMRPSSQLPAPTQEAVINALFAIGEISILGFSVEDDDSRVSETVPCKNGPTYTLSAAAKTFKLHVPEQLISLVQLMMGIYLPAADGTAMAEPAGENALTTTTTTTTTATTQQCKCPDVVRAHAFVTMGKLCLRDLDRSRKLVNVFLRELHIHDPKEGGNPAVRSNALLVLGDLCVRYTSVVDRHVGAMASCLQDPDVMVRKHALVLLTQLLLQDFLKWRGMLLFRFLAMPADSDSELATFAKTVLKSTLKSKFPDLFVQHLSEAVLVFNAAVDHPVYVAAAANGCEGGGMAVTMAGVDLEGPHRRSRRLKLYAVMMEDLSEEQKINATAKITHEILSHALDVLHSATPSQSGKCMSAELKEALEDALLILQSPLLRITRKTADGNGDGEGDDLEDFDAALQSGNDANAIAKAKTKVLVKLSRQHLVSHILPVIVSLKAALEASKSTLQGSVMEYLLSLCKNNKNEVAQVLQNDPTLKAEMEYDLKMFEKAKQEKAVSATVAAAMDILPPLPPSASKRLSRGGDGKGRPSMGDILSPMKSAGQGVIFSPLGKSSLLKNRTPRQAQQMVEVGDLADRLVSGDGGMGEHTKAGDGLVPEVERASKRRSWSVRVSLGSDDENDDDADDDVVTPSNGDSLGDSHTDNENSSSRANVSKGRGGGGGGVGGEKDVEDDIFSPEKKRGKAVDRQGAASTKASNTAPPPKEKSRVSNRKVAKA